MTQCTAKIENRGAGIHWGRARCERECAPGRTDLCKYHATMQRKREEREAAYFKAMDEREICPHCKGSGWVKKEKKP
jgi:hypothetical protein